MPHLMIPIGNPHVTPTASAADPRDSDQARTPPRRADGASPAHNHVTGLRAFAARLADAGVALQTMGSDMRRRAVAPVAPQAPQDNLQNPAHQLAEQDPLDRMERGLPQGVLVVEQVSMSHGLEALQARGQRWMNTHRRGGDSAQRLAWNALANVSTVALGVGSALTVVGAVVEPIAYPLSEVSYRIGPPSASALLELSRTSMAGILMSYLGYLGMVTAEIGGGTRGPIGDAFNLSPRRMPYDVMNRLRSAIAQGLERGRLEIESQLEAILQHFEVDDHIEGSDPHLSEALKTNLFEASGLADDRIDLQNELGRPDTEAGRRLELLEALDFGRACFKPYEYEQVMGEIGQAVTGLPNRLRPPGVAIPPFLNGETPSSDPAELLEQVRNFVGSWPTEPVASTPLRQLSELEQVLNQLAQGLEDVVL